MSESTHIAVLELKPSRTALFGIDYLDFCVDGVSIISRLSFDKYDEVIEKWLKTSFEKYAQAVNRRDFRIKQDKPPRRLSETTQQSMLKCEPSRFCKGSTEPLRKIGHELLLRGDPPAAQRRCRLYGCRNCTCHALTTSIERVDDCFVWHNFLDHYPVAGVTVELGGGPFFFTRENYVEVLEAAMDNAW